MAQGKPGRPRKKLPEPITDIGFLSSPEGLEMLSELCVGGIDYNAIADRTGLRNIDVYGYINSRPECQKAVNTGLAIAINNIENEIYQKSLEHQQVELVEERIFNEDSGEFEFVPVKRTVKTLKGDLNAQKLYMETFDPDKKYAKDSSGNTFNTIIVSADEKMIAAKELILKQLYESGALQPQIDENDINIIDSEG